MEEKKEVSYVKAYNAFHKGIINSPKSNTFGIYRQKLMEAGYTIIEMPVFDQVPEREKDKSVSPQK